MVWVCWVARKNILHKVHTVHCSVWLRGITLIQLTRGSLVLQVILSSSSCAASPPLIGARPDSLSLSQQAQCGPLCLVMVVQCAPYSRFSQRRRFELNHDLHRLIKAIASIARPSLEQVWSGKGWCVVQPELTRCWTSIKVPDQTLGQLARGPAEV